MEALISVLRAMRACHQSAWSCFAFGGHLSPGSRGICHSSHVSARAWFREARRGSSLAWHCFQMAAISALLAIDADP